MVTRYFECKSCEVRVSVTDYPINLTGGIVCNQCGSEIRKDN
jgi:DNA-directed RNA polymerase subunit RPC12/RpoP